MLDNSGAVPSSAYAKVRTQGNANIALGGIDTIEGAALLVTDSGRDDFATTNFPAFSITTTAGRLSSFHSTKLDVLARRGFQFKSAAANTYDITIGSSAVVAHATASSVNGIPIGPGESIFIEVTQLSKIWADAVSGTQILHWVAY